MILFNEKFGRFNKKISIWLEWVGLFALLFILSLTCVDVVGIKVFRMSVFGAIDMIKIAQLVAISFAGPMTLVIGGHIRVDFFLLLFPMRLRVILECIVDFFGFALFVIIGWRLFLYGYSLQIGGEESATARIPLHPFAYGAGLACILLCLVYLQQALQLITKKGVTNES